MRKVQELGVFAQAEGPCRWINIRAGTDDELDQHIAQAKEKGWAEIPLYRGTDPETGWPSVILSKPVQSNENGIGPGQS